MSATTTIGDGWTCYGCGAYVRFNEAHICPRYNPGVTYFPMQPIRLAWTCPVCGKGCAPHVDSCSHENTAFGASEPEGGAP